MTPAVHRAFGIAAALVAIGAVAWGFLLAGSPGSRREERLDERRLSDLQAIAEEVADLVRDPNEPTRARRALPTSLDQVVAEARWRRISTRDPATGESYGYRVLDERRLELCATFTLLRDAGRDVFWNHPAGRACFVVDVLDPP